MPRSGAFEAVLLMILVLLCALMIVILIEGPDRASVYGNGNVSGPVSKIFMSEDGTVYLLGGTNGSTITAIGPDGGKKWSFKVPDRHIVSRQAFTVDDGTVYLYLYEFDNALIEHYGGMANYLAIIDQGYMSDGNHSIMAISDQGKMLWRKDVPGRITYYGTSIYADNGRIYYYHNDSVLVLDRNGRTAFDVSDIYGPPTIDEHGNVYAVRMYYDEHGGYGPGKVIEAYFPNGTIYWRNDLGRKIYGMSNYGPNPPFNSILYYQDDSLYAWVENGTVRLGTDGSIIWAKTFPYNGNEPLKAMPIDSQGNMYYLFHTYPPYIDVVTPDGREILRDVAPHNATLRGNRDGVVYFVDYSFDKTIDQVEKQDLVSARVSAYDILADKFLWNRTFAPGAAELAVTEDDIGFLLGQRLGMHYPIVNTTGVKATIIGNLQQSDPYAHEQAIELSPKGIVSTSGIRTAPGNGVLYLDYYTYNWQYPIADPRATFIYANSLYAIADNGTLLWEKPLSSLVTSMAANNSTLYYSTRNGGFYVENAAKIGGGLALLAMVYLAARFLLVGTVARAKSRLEKNANRNSVMQYIADYPGLTARDIARGIGVNLGTIRYHLLILGLNHKIITYQADRKHVRYFKNSGSYTKDEQLALSLMRRDGMRKVLKLLADNRQMSNQELSRALGMRESAVSRYMKELVAGGIVAREHAGRGNIAYSIREDRIGPIELAMKRIGP